MYCKKCGVKIDDTAKFCPFCGQQTDGSIAQVQQLSQQYKNPLDIWMEKKQKLRKAAIVLPIVSIFSFWLPYYESSLFSLNIWELISEIEESKILLLVAVCAVLAMLSAIKMLQWDGAGKSMAALGIIQVAIIMAIHVAASEGNGSSTGISGIIDSIMQKSFNCGIGWWLMFVSGIGIAAIGGYICYKEHR